MRSYYLTPATSRYFARTSPRSLPQTRKGKLESVLKWQLEYAAETRDLRAIARLLSHHSRSAASGVSKERFLITTQGGGQLANLVARLGPSFRQIPEKDLPDGHTGYRTRLYMMEPTACAALAAALTMAQPFRNLRLDDDAGEPAAFGRQVVISEDDFQPDPAPLLESSFTADLAESIGAGAHVVPGGNGLPPEVIWFSSFQERGRWRVALGRIGAGGSLRACTPVQAERTLLSLLLLRLRQAFPKIYRKLGVLRGVKRRDIKETSVATLTVAAGRSAPDGLFLAFGGVGSIPDLAHWVDACSHLMLLVASRDTHSPRRPNPGGSPHRSHRRHAA